METSNRWLREEEYNRIWMLLEMFMKSTAPLSVLVIVVGETGTGKTTLAKRIIANAISLWKDLRIVYLDPQVDNRHGFSATLQRILNLSGYSTLEILRNMEKSDRRFLIIIDNAETVIGEKSVKDILKIGEGFPNGRFFILLFFSLTSIPVPANTLNFSQPLYFMHLSPYNPDEIRTILKFYLNETENPFVDEDALNVIIKASGGNAKLALEMLKSAMCFSMGRPINENYVLEVLKTINKHPFYYWSIKINNPHIKAILKEVSRYPQGVRLKKLYEEYHSFCKDNGIRPLGYTQFWKKIKILEKMMILDFKVINLKEGRTGIVRIKCINGNTSS